MDSYHFGDYESWLFKIRFSVLDDKSGFGLYGGSQIRTYKGSILNAEHESSHFSKDSTYFHKSSKSSQIFSTL